MAGTQFLAQLLIHMRSDANMRRGYIAELSRPPAERKAHLTTTMEQMKMAGAANDMIEAYKLLLDDSTAEGFLKELRKMN